MRVALVHDWLTGMRGGERVLEELLVLFPDAEIYTLVHVPGSVSARIEARPIHTSFLDRLPGARRHYRKLLPLFPAAIERLHVPAADLVISVSSAVAKAVRPPRGTPHLCYCSTPMRYVWDLYDDYFGPGRASAPIRAIMPALARRLRRWDVASCDRVDAFVANSKHVRERIRRVWGRESTVVYPPVELSRFAAAAEREDFFLALGALVPYKRVDVAVEAFSQLGKPLLVVGDGPERKRLERMAAGNVLFTGWLADAEVAGLLGRCRALLFTAHEDFGIVPLEAQAAGAPVIAYAAGGALETIVAEPPDAATGVFFRTQTPAALAAAVEELESREFEPRALRANAERFSPEAFRAGMLDAVAAVMEGPAVGAAAGAR